MSKVKELFEGGKEHKTELNQELVKLFHEFGGVQGGLEQLMEYLKDEGINLSRKQVIGKLSISGVKQIVPKVEKVKKDTGPTKKELITVLCDYLELSPVDLGTFNNVKKAELNTLISAVKNLVN